MKLRDLLFLKVTHYEHTLTFKSRPGFVEPGRGGGGRRVDTALMFPLRSGELRPGPTFSLYC